MDERHDVQRQWKEWSETEPKLDDRGLRRELLERLPERRSSRTTRLVLVAAAASMLALLIGYENSRQPAPPPTVEPTEVVYETGPNVILVLREGAEPIYVLTEPPGADGRRE
jgi:hypothetical protein